MTTTTPFELPPVGTIVLYGKSRYEIVAHGCATHQGNRCQNHPYALTAYQLDKHGLPKWTQTLCIPGDKVTL